MAKLIERIIETVIEDPVVDILAESDIGGAAASHVPALNSGPVGRQGRVQISGAVLLAEAQLSDAGDLGKRFVPEGDSFSILSKSGANGQAGSEAETGSQPDPSGAASSRGFPFSQQETGGNEDDSGQAPQPDAVPGATVFGTASDDMIDVKFVFPGEVRTEPGTFQGTTHRADVVAASGGDDVVNGGGGDDAIDGGAGDDTLNGEDDHDTLVGGSGDDTLEGGCGDDVLAGGAGDDILTGGDGNDQLVGDGGTDQLTGGSGADRFVFVDAYESSAHAPDLVFDFNAVQGDRIDVSGIDAVSGTAENEEFIFIGDEAFSGSAGELRFVEGIEGGLLEGDVNADALADFTIELLGVKSLAGDDIMGIG